jgi:hypothetical protein
MVIVFLVLPAIGSAAGVGMLIAAIVSSSTPPAAATTALNTRETSDDEHHHGRHGDHAEEGRERGTVEDGPGPDDSAEGVDLDSGELFGYGYGTLFGGMFVLVRWGECAYVRISLPFRSLVFFSAFVFYFLVLPHVDLVHVTLYFLRLFF